MSRPSDSLVLSASTALKQGNYAEAEQLLAAAIAGDSDSADAHAQMGCARLALDRPADALASFDRALAIDPLRPDVLVDRGAALRFMGRTTEALASYDAALRVRPAFAPALGDRADLLQGLRRFDEAIAGYDAALAVMPDHGASLAGRAHALVALGRLEEAAAAYGKAIAVQGGNVELRNARAHAQLKLGRHDEALLDWDAVLAADPRHFAALLGRGNVMRALGRHEAALAAYDEAVAAAPDQAVGHYNRALALGELDRKDEAIAAYARACAIKPDYSDALFALAILQSERGRNDEAIATLQQLLAVDGDYPYAVGNRTYIGAQICDWTDYETLVRRVEEGASAGKPTVVPFALLALSPSARTQHACATAVVDKHHPGEPLPLWGRQRYAHDRIRIAYISANFGDHALAYLIAGLFEVHDRRKFEVTGMAIGPRLHGAVHDRIVATFDRFVDLSADDDAEAAKRIRDLEIDIAVDLMGFTKGSRTGIYAHRPAPVQVQYLGFPGTMGAAYIDYLIVDRFVVPDATRQHFTENVVYLPDTFQANDDKRAIAGDTPSRDSLGLPPEGFVFCAFNNSYKITPAMFAIWMRLLERVPQSVLWLVAGHPQVAVNLRREAQARGIVPTRLVFAPRIAYAEHLARFRRADLFLDTLPFNGGTTASDALWAGVPIVTCAGEAFASRMAGSLLHAIGLPELITTSLADYEALALHLATDASALPALKHKLVRNRATFPLFDTDRFRRNIEAAYETMWQKAQTGEAPATFAVPG